MKSTSKTRRLLAIMAVVTLISALFAVGAAAKKPIIGQDSPQGVSVQNQDNDGTTVRTLNTPGVMDFLTGPQNGEPLDIALAYLQSQTTALGLTNADFSDFTVTDQYQTGDTGVTHIYLRQNVDGIGITDAHININIAKDGRVINVGNSFVPDAANVTNGTRAELTANQAVSFAAEALNLGVAEPVSVIENLGGAANEMILSNAGISQDNIPAKLVYVPTAPGILRLAWDLVIYENSSLHWWNVQIDAATGKMLSSNDWIVNENHSHSDGISFDLPHVNSQTAGTSTASKSNFIVPDGSSYNVIAWPLEAPSFGARSIENEPADDTASPFGWHDTNGDITPEDTRTIGNNVHAALDLDANNIPDPGSEPDGGAGLDFNFPFDDVNDNPDQYQDATITNLFYWNNVTHDITYHHGFDEASGNFQSNNYGNGGLGNDFVWADGQDGSGTNNANFGTPPDGQNPRMQMFIWTNPFDQLMTVNIPLSIAGDYVASSSSNGGTFNGVSGNLVIVEDGTAPTTDACEALVNPGAINGNIALILWNQGQCNSSVFVQNAADAGAIGAIIIDNTPDPSTNFGGSPAIPSIAVGNTIGQAILDEINNNGETVNVTIDDNPSGQINRDSDFDSGIIVHEYGHGVSNRLTGGPSQTGCLSNAEQMGEGWSDLLALMLTATPSQTDVQGRGVGTYVQFEPTNGPGIRAFPYSTDMMVDPRTFADVPATVSTGSPHAHGSIWTAMVWEVYWELVDKYGFNPDIYGDWTTGGNNLALRLMLDGMKFQPCSPGFVDGRDGILAADLALTGGANQCEIWTGFAKRGLGANATQGSTNDVTDGTVDFSLPPQCLAPDFVLNVTPAEVDICSPDPADFTIGIQTTFGYSDDITFSATGVPGGYTESFSTNPVTPPDTITMTLSNTGAAVAGAYDVEITGMAPTSTHTSTVQVDLFTDVPVTVTLDAPADASTNASILPELSWTSVDGVSFFVEVATDAGFSNIIETATVDTNSYQLTTVLNNTTIYYWRVTASNACGNGATSAVYSFTTVDDGSCEVGEVTDILYFDDMESGAPGYTHGATVDADTWNLSMAQAFSGQYSYHVVDTSQPSDQYLDSPSINLTLPAGDNFLTLQFQNLQNFEDPAGSGGCWDGGLLEINNGSGWVQLDGELLTDPYDGVGNNGPPTGLDLWCGKTNGSQPWTNSVVDLSAYAGDDVEIRWRMLTDAAAGAEGWYIDDVTVQACTAVTGPQIVTDPAVSALQQFPDVIVTDTLDISNVGNADLNWTIDEAASNDCNSPSDIGWLSLAPTMSTTISNTTTSVDAIFDSTGMAAGVYTGTICVNSNDVGQPTVEVLATLEVIPEESNIEVDPVAMSSAQLRDTQVDQTLTISNTGALDLNWSIEEAPAIYEPPVARTNGGVVDGAKLSVDGNAVSGVTAEYPPLLMNGGGSIFLTHSLTQTIVSGNSVACTNGGITSDNAYIRVFDLAALGVNGINVTEVSFGIETATAGSGGMQPATVNLYELTGPLAYANMTLVASEAISITDQTLSIVSVPISASFAPGTVLVAELFIPDATGGAGHAFYVGSNDGGQTDATYLASAGCGINDPLDTASIGFPDMHLVLNVIGEPFTGCALPSDVSWLSVSPISGTTSSNASSDVTISYDSTGLVDGTYESVLCITNNDPDTPLVEVPVTLEVLPSPDIEVNPDALSSLQPTNSTVSHTLTISNVGGANLDWNITEDSFASQSIVRQDAVVNWEAIAAAQENGGLATSAIGEASHATATNNMVVLYDQTATQTTSGTTSEFFLDFGGGSEQADDFVVPAGGGWDVDAVTTYGFYPAGNVNTVTAVYVGIYEDNGGLPGTPVHYEYTTNFTDTAGVITADLSSSVHLNPGTYWMSLQVEITYGGGVGRRFWFTTDTSPGTDRVFQDVLDIFGTGCTSWASAATCIGATTPGLSFQILGTVGADVSCAIPEDIPWLSVSPTSGTTSPSGADDVTVTFDSTGMAAGDYTSVLCIDSNDHVDPLVTVPVTMTVTPCATPSDITTTISYSGTEVTVSWMGGDADEYMVYKGNDPYAPVYDSMVMGSPYVDMTGAGNPATNWYYYVVPNNTCGASANPSNTTGAFDFAITPGTP